MRRPLVRGLDLTAGRQNGKLAVGGVSLTGGKGSILNAVIGTLMLAGLANLMNIMLISSHLQDAVSGLIIVLAIMLNARLNPST